MLIRSPKFWIAILLGILFLSSCAPLVELDEACQGEEIVDVAVEGYISIDYCNQADDGQVLCRFFVVDDGDQLPVLLRTNPESVWPTGMYPKLSAETVKGYFCGDAEDCSQGENKTWFRVSGQCNPIKHWLFVKGFKSVKPIN